jgi:glycosyltransferase involved in cell wall biosynthesis
MKIIQIYAHYYPHFGGVEQRIRTLSERLAKKGHQVEVFTSNIGCPKDKQLRSTKNLKIHYLPAKEIFHTTIIPSLYGELVKVPTDSIISVHLAQQYIPEIVYMEWKKRKIPYIVHIRYIAPTRRDPQPTTFFGKILFRPYKIIFLKRFLKHAKKIVVLTKDYKKLIHNQYLIDNKKIVIIPNGNDFNIKSNKKNKNKNIEILFVGRLSYEKNIPLLLNSFRKVVLKNKNIILKIVGDGKEREFIEKYILKNNLKNNVFLIGRLEGEKLEKAYQNADIFISTTRQETFGAVYIEAMASGLPIITSNVPGVRNVIKNNYNGLLVNQTPEAFSNAIEKLIKNPKLREKLARNGLKEVKKYSWDKIVEQTERVYEEVLKEHNKKLNKK